MNRSELEAETPGLSVDADRAEGVAPSVCRANFLFSEAVFLCPNAAALAVQPGVVAKLRGALGAELRHGASDAALAGVPCGWQPPCALDVLWRPRREPDVPTPWVFALDAAGDDLLITLRLFGDAGDYLPEAAQAVVLGLRRGLSGIGPMAVADRMLRRGRGLPPPIIPGDLVTLRFVTPLILRDQQAAHADADALLRGMVRRIDGIVWWSGQSIAPFAPELLAAVAAIEATWIDVDRESWTRFSVPQARRIGMEGQTGRLQLRGAGVSVFADLIAMASLTFVGGRTAFGQGRFVVEEWQ